MKKTMLLLAVALVCLTACEENQGPTTDNGKDNPVICLPYDSTMQKLKLQSEVTHVQPMTGLVLWPNQANARKDTHGKNISLEYSYCLPCKVVTGKADGQIQYDWSSFETLLDGIKSRNHQAIIRFRYEYPNNKDVDGERGTTAVPQYIKDLPDYEETYSKNAGGDGQTYYADWSNAELQWFTKQFYTDFAARYGNDPRIAFLEVGFGHWSEYHIYGTPLKLGTNFPTHAYQKEFLQHVADVMPIPWGISIDAADDTYTPIVGDPTLMALNFGLFDDSFMHEHHEIRQGDGYNETCWNAIGQNTRWQTGYCGGEVSYYEDSDQRDFLNPEGMYGVVWEDAAAKYHISFMLANDAPGRHGTAERFLSAGLATGYHFAVLDCQTKEGKTQLLVTNTGVAPIYRDAYFAVGGVRGEETLRGFLPGDTCMFTVAAKATATNVTIESDHILPTQAIEFDVK